MSDKHAFERQLTEDVQRLKVTLESGMQVPKVNAEKLAIANRHLARANELAHEAWGLKPPVV